MTKGDKEGAAKWPNVFKTPMDIAERPIKITNGNIILVNETVRANFSGKGIKPGANKVTRTGAKKKPAMVNADKTKKDVKKTDRAR